MQDERGDVCGGNGSGQNRIRSTPEKRIIVDTGDGPEC